MQRERRAQPDEPMGPVPAQMLLSAGAASQGLADDPAGPEEGQERRIKYINGGGTFCMPRKNGKPLEADAALSPRIDRCMRPLVDMAHIDYEVVFPLDSNRLKPEDVVELGWAIYRAASDKNYKGVVFNIGTDKSPGVMARLSLMVQNAPIPIVGFGSARPLVELYHDDYRLIEDSDAKTNLMSALNLASLYDEDLGGEIPGYYYVFNEGRNVYWGPRLTEKVDPRSPDAFGSYGCIGTMENGRLKLRKGMPGRKLMDSHKRRMRMRKIGFYPYFDEGVEMIPLTMGYDYTNLGHFFDKGKKGLLLVGSGEGNTDPSAELLNYINMFIDHRRLVCLTTSSHVKATTENYDLARPLYDRGVVATGNTPNPLEKQKFAVGIVYGDRPEISREEERIMRNVMKLNVGGELYTRSLPPQCQLTAEEKAEAFEFMDSRVYKGALPPWHVIPGK
jgi:L-asparaginase/Glu-tRNA(Gln) amidotransferase subunit D